MKTGANLLFLHYRTATNHHRRTKTSIFHSSSRGWYSQGQRPYLLPIQRYIHHTSTRPVCHLYDVGLVPYMEAWKWQQTLINERILFSPSSSTPTDGEPPASSPSSSNDEKNNKLPHKNIILMLEHPHVYTLGRAATINHLLWQTTDKSSSPSSSSTFPSSSPLSTVSYATVAQSTDISTTSLPGPDGSEVYRIERGGKVTYHGPGQLVIYPLFDLRQFKQDLHWYVTCMEEIIITILRTYGIQGERSKGYPGVWVNDRKIAAVGMACSKWYTYHGLALNITTDMKYFRNIIPCGIDDKEVTSLEFELIRIAQQEGCTVQQYLEQRNLFSSSLLPFSVNAIKPIAVTAIQDIFQCEIIHEPNGSLPFSPGTI